MERPLAAAVAANALLVVAIALFIWYAISLPPACSGGCVFGVSGKRFNITMVAANDTSRERGLMNTTITNGTIMIFVFQSPGDYPFWMKNTYSSLDMMWLDVSGDSGRVVYIANDTASCVGQSDAWCAEHEYDPRAPADYVIEARAGFARSNNITVGSQVTLGSVNGLRTPP